MLFCPTWFWSKTLAWVLLALHILLDGVDGPLARHLGVASNKGSFTDTMSDQVVIAGTTAALMASSEAGALAGMAYVVVYTTVVLFAFMRNALSVPYAWLVRPRFFVYGWFVVETYLWPGTLDYVLWTASGLLVLKVASGFFRIRARL
jgi:phosphatidylglycerophosphate synthase